MLSFKKLFFGRYQHRTDKYSVSTNVQMTKDAFDNYF